MKNFKFYIIIFAISILCISVNAQTQQKKVSEMTNEQLMELTYDDLLNLSFEDLILVANKFGLSADDLLEYFLNKDVTSASKRAEKTLNSPLSSTVLSRDDIVNSGATSIPEALRLVPGLIVREKTPGNYDVQIRGNDNLPPNGIMVYTENSMTLVMIDGRPVYNYAFGGTFWETLPIELNDIDRIEVIRGPSSALYGPNAVSGAINIITRSVDSKKLHAEAQAQVGNINSKLASASVSFGVEDLKVRVSGNYTRFDRFENDFYVFDYNKYYSGSEINNLKMPAAKGGGYIEADTNQNSNFNSVFPNPNLATEKYAGNAFLSYDVTKEIGFNLAFGAQNSDVISSTLGNNNIPIVPRNSNTQYVDFRAKIYGLQAQANYMGGDQQVQHNYPGWHIAPSVFNSLLEYEYKLGTLILRPGVSYQTTTYDDSQWGHAALKDGFLNGPKTLTSFAYYLRADYKVFDKLRLIAALRGDKYNAPDVNKFTYQLISTYDINENNIVRAGYSRANRGPFISDTYANYNWKVIPNYYTLQYEGNQNLKLPTMDMFELGYRSKISKNIMFELEAFHTVLKDMTFWTPDSMTLYFNLGPMTRLQAPSQIPYKIEGHGQYQNLNLISTQDGITCNVSVVINSKLNFKVFGTLQQSKLTNVYNRTIYDDLGALQNSCGSQFAGDVYKVLHGDPSPLADTLKKYTAGYNTIKDSSKNTMYNKNTPTFFGGLTINYAPVKKWNINSSFYFYSQQTMLINRTDEIGCGMPENINNPNYRNNGKYTDMFTIQPKVTMNLKVSYKFWKENSVFINARNLFNSSSREFAYLDKVGGLYMIGVNLGF
jgi:iron complex outermembrane receptor protein